jgi:DNA-binding IclR family transcriptional regulator
VSLLVMEGDTVHFIDGIESQLTVRVSARIGGRKPAHSTSAGKAILAALPAAEVLALYPDDSLASVTDRTLTNRSSLLAELDQIRADGFATNFEESEGGLGAVGRAVLDADGRPAAGIAVAVPMQRMSREYVLQIAAELAVVTAAASADLAQDARSRGDLIPHTRINRPSIPESAPAR